MARTDPKPQHPHAAPKTPKGREGDEVISTRGASPAPGDGRPESKDRGRDRNPGDERRDEKGKVDGEKGQRPPKSPPKGG